MNQDNPPISPQDAAWDDAVTTRLARLRSMPVDAGRLQAAIGRQIPRLPARRLWIGPMRAAVAAAGLVILGLLIVLIVNSSGTPVMAASQIAQLHEDLVSGRVHSVHVDSIDAARKALAEQVAGAVALPDVPNDHVMACCMKSVKGRQMECVLLDKGGTPVTMTVASAADMRPPDAPKVVRDGATYYVQSIRDLNMVVTQRQGQWVCLIGKLTAEQLMDAASQLHFQ